MFGTVVKFFDYQYNFCGHRVKLCYISIMKRLTKNNGEDKMSNYFTNKHFVDTTVFLPETSEEKLVREARNIWFEFSETLNVADNKHLVDEFIAWLCDCDASKEEWAESIAKAVGLY